MTLEELDKAKDQATILRALRRQINGLEKGLLQIDCCLRDNEGHMDGRLDISLQELLNILTRRRDDLVAKLRDVGVEP